MAQKNLLKGIRESLYQSCQFSFFSFFSSVFTQTIEPILDFYSFWKQIVQENLTLLNAVFSQSKKKKKILANAYSRRKTCLPHSRYCLCSQYMQKFRELFKSQKSLLLN